MADEKKAKLETRSVKGSWDVKYKWRFDVAMLERYTQGLGQKKVVGTHCPECGRVYAPPTDLCGKCYRSLDEWVDVKDTAELVMYTVGYTSITGDPYDTPRITAMIRFDGSDSWFLANVIGIKPEELKVGMKLKAVWREEPKGQLSDIEGFEPL